MKRPVAVLLILIFIAFGLVVARFLSDVYRERAKVARSMAHDEEAERLVLTGVWGGKGDAGQALSIGIRNTGTASIKAFRATLIKRNDFNENDEAAAVEHTSDSRYVNANWKQEFHHLLKPSETMFLNSVDGGGTSMRYSSAQPVLFAQRAEGHFILKVTDVAVANAEDVGAAVQSDERPSARSSPAGSAVSSQTPATPTATPPELRGSQPE